MIHERLAIEHWKSVFSLARLREEAQATHMPPPEACGITGPYDIAVLEQLREAAYANLPGIEREPVDIFVWNRGEPEQRAVTKIGGLPYRAAGKPWPIAPFGTPMNFMAQFCFADSRDIVSDLPGDVLLIFAEGKRWGSGEHGGYAFSWGDNDPEQDSAVAFEWVSLGDFPLVTASDVPATNWQFAPCYGTIYRTWDYPTVDGFAYPAVSEHISPITEATKIGGVCPWIQDEEDVAGTFLCSLNSVFPEISQPFPFLNVPDPMTFEESYRHYLMIGDVGLLYFFVTTYGDIRWTGQGH